MSILAFLVLMAMFIVGVKFNIGVLKALSKINDTIANRCNNTVGAVCNKLNIKFKRSAYLNKEKPGFKIYKFFDTILDDLNLQKSGVTVVGLLMFISLLSLVAAIALSIMLRMASGILFAFIAVFILITILFKYNSVTRAEAKEAHVLDAIDLIVSDINRGVYNAIVRYRYSFHTSIQGYFDDFITNISTHGFSFTQAMEKLNDDLGYTFSNFAHKAIMFEQKADAEMVEIFSDIIEINAKQRELRTRAGEVFRELRAGVFASLLLICIFGAVSIAFEPNIYYLFFETLFGKVLILFDIVLVAYVWGRFTMLKVKFLK